MSWSAIRHVRRHRWRDARGLLQAHQVVMREVPRHRCKFSSLLPNALVRRVKCATMELTRTLPTELHNHSLRGKQGDGMDKPRAEASISARQRDDNSPPGLSEIVSVGFDAATWTFKFRNILSDLRRPA
jgi:hypothetical protein